MILTSIASVAVGIAAALPVAPSGVDPTAFSVTRLSLDLHVDYDRATLGGSATLHLRNDSKSSRREIPFLLNRLMTVSRVTSPAGKVLRFQQSARMFEDDSVLQVNAVVVDAMRPIASGDSITVVLRYAGTLVGYIETGSLYIQDRVSRDFTIIREDAFAFPRLGVPSWKVNRAARSRDFAFDARLTVPSDLVVAMGGQPRPVAKKDSLATWEYRSTTPVPFLNITIAPYKVLESPAVRIFYFPQDSSGARMIERAVAGAMRTFATWYGALRDERQLVVMEIPEGFGSQASLSAGILQTADAFRDRRQLRQIYHELSHLWNVADLDAPSPRWNEGLASFLQWRMAEELDGWSDWDARVDRTVQLLMTGCGEASSCASVPMAEFGLAGLTDHSYQLGMLMFKALYDVLGAAMFDRTYAAYYQEHREQGGTTAQLADAFRAVSSKSDPILADWLFTTRWRARLASGESLAQIIASYR